MNIAAQVEKKNGPDANQVFYVQAVIKWATEAAREAKELADYYNEPVTDGGMGLWQTFRAEFPKEQLPGDYDLYIATWFETYKQVLASLGAEVA